MPRVIRGKFAPESGGLEGIRESCHDLDEASTKRLKPIDDLPSRSLVNTANLARLEVDVGSGGTRLAQLASASVGQLRQWFQDRVLAIYVERQFDEPALAQISPNVTAPPSDEYSLPMRFASWLTLLDAPQVRAVPTYLNPWLPLEKALVVPLVVDGHHRGALVLESAALSRVEVRRIEDLARQLSETLRDFERQSPQGVNTVRDRFAHSVRRIKITTQV